MLRLPSKLKMLIVEDDIFIGKMIKSFFGAMTWEFYAATNGNEALKSCLEHYPNVIITDLMMPDKDGFWLIDQLRKLPDFAVIPIIAVTAGDADMQAKAMNLGAHMVLAKPLHQEALTSAIDALLRASPYLKR